MWAVAYASQRGYLQVKGLTPFSGTFPLNLIGVSVAGHMISLKQALLFLQAKVFAQLLFPKMKYIARVFNFGVLRALLCA